MPQNPCSCRWFNHHIITTSSSHHHHIITTSPSSRLLLNVTSQVHAVIKTAFSRFPILHAKAASQLAQAERALLLACEETCETMCQLGHVTARVPQELFVMQRYSQHIESILTYLQAKDTSAAFLKKNGGKCIDAALLLAEWYSPYP